MSKLAAKREQILILLGQGLRQQEIALQVGCHQPYVARIAREAGLQMGQADVPHLRASALREPALLLRAEGLSYQKIAERLTAQLGRPVSRQAVAYALDPQAKDKRKKDG